jgi:hypothetical protein
MSLVLAANPSIFLLVTGYAAADALVPTKDPLGFWNGLTFRFPRASHGTVDIIIAPPTDLSEYADLSAASILKPVCLPLALTELQHGAIHATLNAGPKAHALAQKILAAEAAMNPAHSRRCCHCHKSTRSHANMKES